MSKDEEKAILAKRNQDKNVSVERKDGDKSMIKVNNVSKSFGKEENRTQVLRGVNLEIEKGEFVSLMGASGSGKSTLLYLIGGLDRGFEGNIEIDGADLTKMKEKELSKIRLQKIGFIFQFYNLVQNLSVEDNVLLPLMVRGKKRSELEKDLKEILEITGLTEKRKAYPAQLSGGQQQRVAIARAVMGNPEILLYGIDPEIRSFDAHARSIVICLRCFFSWVDEGTVAQALDV